MLFGSKPAVHALLRDGHTTHAAWKRRVRQRCGDMHDEDGMTDWLCLIRAEYTESPGLHLTKPQVRRLWNLDSHVCDEVLAALEDEHFLRKTAAGGYVRAHA